MKLAGEPAATVTLAGAVVMLTGTATVRTAALLETDPRLFCTITM